MTSDITSIYQTYFLTRACLPSNVSNIGTYFDILTTCYTHMFTYNILMQYISSIGQCLFCLKIIRDLLFFLRLRQVEVLVPPAVQAMPREGIITTRKGNDVTLRCAGRGNPNPRITWTKKVSSDKKRVHAVHSARAIPTEHFTRLERQNPFPSCVKAL